jgi:hypothetical protein
LRISIRDNAADQCFRGIDIRILGAPQEPVATPTLRRTARSSSMLGFSTRSLSSPPLHSGQIWVENVWGKAVHSIAAEGISPEQVVDEAVALSQQILSEYLRYTNVVDLAGGRSASALEPLLQPLARISQCAQTARITSGGRFHPDSCRV